MSRPALRTPARYSLPDTDRVRADLALLGLWGPDGPIGPNEEILSAISRSGRPELAVYGLARLYEADRNPAQIMEALRTQPRFRGRLIGLLGASTVLSEHLAAWPEDWHDLLPEAPAEELVPAEGMRRVLCDALGIDHTAPPCTGTEGARATVTGATAIAALRRAYRSQLLIIAAHDLAPAIETSLPTTALPAVCHALTALADLTLQAGLAAAAGELTSGAAPVRLGVIAMGKTGAKELNYLSDVDVMFIADGDETALMAANQLASRMMRICGAAAWEVDAALRPEGKAGALVRTPAGFTSYYQRWAHTWEFQALLKARPAAGDLELGQVFMDITRPGVWSAAGRESFVDDVQAMRRRVEDNIPDKHRDRELKLGAGGLRDVEFAVQLLQLVHGRSDPDLRLPGTLMGLRSLIRGGYVGRTDGAEMAAAYTFLRRAEHRLQLQRLRRTHLLPDDGADMEWLARADGYVATGTSNAAEVFVAERLRHATTVRRLHEKLFYRPLLKAVAAVDQDETRMTVEAARERLAALGFSRPDAAIRHLASLTQGVSRRAAIQRHLLPVLLDYFATSPDPDAGLLAYVQVSEALADTPWYLRLLRDEGSVAHRLAGLLGGSRLVAALLPRAPDVLKLLVDDAALLAPEPETVATALMARARRAGSAPEAVDVARSGRRHEMLRLACGDMLCLISVTNIARGLTSVAEITIGAALQAAIKQVTKDRGGFRARFAVIGMGRLGGGELGYSSDADVVFVMEPLPGEDESAARADAHAVADLMSRLLGRPTPDPPLEIDANLRPEGKNGPLVRPLAGYLAYWTRNAVAWERQALLRARPVAGDPELGAAFVAAADEFRYPAGGLSLRDVVEIRRIKARMDAERLPRTADRTTHTKLGRGGLADVEWTIQLLQLQHAFEIPDLRTPSTLPAIAAAARAGLISDEDAEALTNGWLVASRTRNAIMLVRGKPDDQIPRQGRELSAIARACGYPAGGDPGEFVDDYRRATRRARKVVDRVFDSG